MSRKVLTKDEIRALFEEYKTNERAALITIAEKSGLHRSTLNKAFKRHFYIEYKSLQKNKRQKLSKMCIIKAFEEYKKAGSDSSTISKSLGVNQDTLRLYFKKYFGDEYHKISKTKLIGRGERRLSREDIFTSFKKYKEYPEIRLCDIATELDCNAEALSRLFKKVIGPAYRDVSKEKSIWNRKLTKENIRKIFLEYKNGVSAVDLANKYNVSRDTLTHSMARIIGNDYREIAKIRRLEDSGKKRRKISEEGIKEAFEIYKHSRMSIDTLASRICMKENSLIFRFKKLFGDEYRKIAISRRDERKVKNKDYIYAFEKYKNTNISLFQLAGELDVSVSSLTSKFRRLFGEEYFYTAERKSDSFEIDKKGRKFEELVLQYFKLLGEGVDDVRRKRIIKNSLKTPDFLIGNKFVEVKTHYVTLNGFGHLKGYSKILDSYLNKQTKDGITLNSGILVSLSGFSPEVRNSAKKDKITLIGTKELENLFRKNGRGDLLDGLKSI